LCREFSDTFLTPDIDPEGLSASRKVTRTAREKTTRELGLTRRTGMCDGSQNRSMRRPEVFECGRISTVSAGAGGVVGGVVAVLVKVLGGG